MKDAEGLQTMRTLARNMTFLMKSIALGREQYGLPEKETVEQGRDYEPEMPKEMEEEMLRSWLSDIYASIAVSKLGWPSLEAKT